MAELVVNPDAHPETSSVDGRAQRYVKNVSWSNIHDGAGTLAQSDRTTEPVELATWDTTDEWLSINRLFLLFDTSSIPLGTEIKSALVSIHATAAADPLGISTTFKVGIVSSDPNNDTDIIVADYQSIGNTLLSNTYTHEDCLIGAVKVFTLNTSGRSQIVRGGITKLGIREFTYDVADLAPPWTATSVTAISFRMADHLSGPYPELTVTYDISTLLPGSLWVEGTGGGGGYLWVEGTSSNGGYLWIE